MLLTRETVLSDLSMNRESAAQSPSDEYLAGAFVIREVPVVLIGTDSITKPNRFTLHYPRLQVEGIGTLIPEAIEIDVTSIARGGQVRIDELPMPPCCEVIGVWFANPVVTVGQEG